MAVGLLMAAGVRVEAQTPGRLTDSKQVRAAHIDGGIAVDGSLDEPAWQQAQPISDFVQQEPHVNAPGTERTEVRVLVAPDGLYFGVRCDEVGGVIARERRRDSTFADDDRFEIVIDSFHDHRNAFHFVINPLGTQYDALSTDEGRDINAEWDERWWSETRITEAGWTAEIRIPFSTLRSDPESDVYGINFLRFTRRRNERVLWTAWDRDFQFLQVSQAGLLTGMRGVRTGLRLRVKPFLLEGVRRDGSTAGRTVQRPDAGLEVLRLSLTPGLTAEFTANTDFAQTEVDEAVVNLTRFPVFFPERREFFLERAGIFEFGLGGRRGGQAERNLQMFFSRRIGLTDDRQPVPILAGGKLVGRAAGLDVGLIAARVDGTRGGPQSQYTVLRTKRNILGRSNIGTFLSSREAAGNDFNRVAGVDATITVGKNTDFQGFIARSWTPGVTGDSLAGRAKYNWFRDRYELFAEYLYVGREFRHDVGYVRRGDMGRSNLAAIWQPRPKLPNVRNMVFRGELVYITDTAGRLQTREQVFQTTTRWQSDDAVRYNVTATFDDLPAPFRIAQGVTLPAGPYTFLDQFVEGEAGGKRALSGRVRVGGGEFYSGHRRYVRVAPALKPSAIMALEASYEMNDVTLPQGAFRTHVLNTRASINVTNRWLTTTIAQYDSASRRTVLYGRLNYIYRPGDDLFLVINRTSDRTTGAPADFGITVKLTRSFDF